MSPSADDRTRPSSYRGIGDGRVFYGAHCVYWTDDFSKLRTWRGIPVCPECEQVGFETTFTKFIEGSKQHEVEGFPGYLNLVIWMKGRCFRDYEAARTAYTEFLGHEAGLPL